MKTMFIVVDRGRSS